MNPQCDVLGCSDQGQPELADLQSEGMASAAASTAAASKQRIEKRGELLGWTEDWPELAVLARELLAREQKANEVVGEVEGTYARA